MSRPNIVPLANAAPTHTDIATVKGAGDTFTLRCDGHQLFVISKRFNKAAAFPVDAIVQRALSSGLHQKD